LQTTSLLEWTVFSTDIPTLQGKPLILVTYAGLWGAGRIRNNFSGDAPSVQAPLHSLFHKTLSVLILAVKDKGFAQTPRKVVPDPS